MNKQKDKNQYALRLAVAAATLGMSMGISPDVVLASPDTEVGQEPVRVAAANVDYGKIEHRTDPKAHVKPGAVFPKVEHPGVQYEKFDQPGVKFPKREIIDIPTNTQIIDIPSNTGNR